MIKWSLSCFCWFPSICTALAVEFLLFINLRVDHILEFTQTSLSEFAYTYGLVRFCVCRCATIVSKRRRPTGPTIAAHAHEVDISEGCRSQFCIIYYWIGVLSVKAFSTHTHTHSHTHMHTHTCTQTFTRTCTHTQTRTHTHTHTHAHAYMHTLTTF